MAERIRLIDSAVAALEPLVVSERMVWDSQFQRFGLRVTAAGSKTFVLRLRIDGRQRWISIGRFGDPWTCEDARSEALRLANLAAHGTDPTTARARLKTLPTVEELVERFMTTYAMAHMKPSSRETVRCLFDTHLLPRFGKLRIDQLAKADLERMHLDMRDRPVSANRTVAMAHSLFERAQEWGLMPEGSNPARKVASYKERPRKRFLSDAEWLRLGHAISDAEAKGENLYFIAALKLICLTGCRGGEIFGLTWDEARDFERGVLHLADSKTGPKDVALPAAGIAVLKALPRKKNNPFVIAGHVRGQHFAGESKSWQRLRAVAKLDDVRLHDLRHSYAARAIGQGTSLRVVGELLGHANAATTMRYAHVGNTPLQNASDLAGGAIAVSLGLQAAPTVAVETMRPTTRRPRIEVDE